MAEIKKTSPDSNTASASPRGGSLLVSILSILNLILTLALFGILFVSFQKEKHKASLQDVTTHEPEKGEEKKEGEEAPHGEGGEKTKGKEGKEGKEAEARPKMVDLVPLTINLSTTSGAVPKFARVTISIEPQNMEVEEEVKGRLPQIQNVIIDLFNAKRPSELSTGDGREFLKEEIKNAINHFLLKGKINGIYFTNFALSG